MRVWARRLRSGVLLGLSLLTLAGCGNDTGKTENTQIIRGTAREIIARVMPSRTAPIAAPIPPEQLAASALASFPGPLIMVTFETTAATTVLGLYGENGAMRTYATAAEQSLILRQGFLAGTRGFGHDLISADTEAVAALVLKGATGQADKVMRYLDGEGAERPIRLRCDIESGPLQRVDMAGQNIAIRQVSETCRSAATSFANSYVVMSDGSLLASRQWIGPELGYIAIQTLRP
jgi:hypothetical protein